MSPYLNADPCIPFAFNYGLKVNYARADSPVQSILHRLGYDVYFHERNRLLNVDTR